MSQLPSKGVATKRCRRHLCMYLWKFIICIICFIELLVMAAIEHVGFNQWNKVSKILQILPDSKTGNDILNMYIYTHVIYICTYLWSCSGLYGITATGFSDGRLCTSISPLNVRLIRHGQPVELYVHIHLW